MSVDSPWIPVAKALKAAPGTAVTVKGWVRTRRDSKADGGLSFIALHDGTCFDTIQIVAKGNLPNYAGDVARLVTGASIECDGTIVTNPKGGAEIGVQQISELLPVAGIEIVGPLPAALQRITIFSAGVLVAAKEPEAARALVQFVATASRPLLKDKGLEPA